MKKTLLGGAIAMAGLLGACSASETDYKEAAEKYIKEQMGADSSADCQDPADAKVGTTFTCTATAADGSTVEWIGEIAADNKVNVGPIGSGAVPTEEAPAEEVPAEDPAEETEEELEEETEEG